MTTTNTDRELLELAAIAEGGHTVGYRKDNGERHVLFRPPEWNPLTNDADALRLAVKLSISTRPYPIYEKEKHSVIAKQFRKSDLLCEANPTEVVEVYGDDQYAATRRAIVRAAAEIGRNMK